MWPNVKRSIKLTVDVAQVAVLHGMIPSGNFLSYCSHGSFGVAPISTVFTTYLTTKCSASSVGVQIDSGLTTPSARGLLV